MPATSSSSSFSVETAHNPFETTSFGAAQAPPPAASAVSTEVQQEEQWEEDWDQHDGAEVAAAAESKATIESTVTSTTSITTTTTTTIQTEAVAAPVELTSPGADAGEFWGDGDEDELFDHDDHADEEWDESIKGQANAQQDMPLTSSENPSPKPAQAFPGQETSFSMPAPPPPQPSTPVVEAPAYEQQSVPLPEVAASAFNYSVAGHVEEAAAPSHEESIGQSPPVAEASSLPPPRWILRCTRRRPPGSETSYLAGC